MRISDWSSDVCSSDLDAHTLAGRIAALILGISSPFVVHVDLLASAVRPHGSARAGPGSDLEQLLFLLLERLVDLRLVGEGHLVELLLGPADEIGRAHV